MRNENQTSHTSSFLTFQCNFYLSATGLRKSLVFRRKFIFQFFGETLTDQCHTGLVRAWVHQKKSQRQICTHRSNEFHIRRPKGAENVKCACSPTKDSEIVIFSEPSSENNTPRKIISSVHKVILKVEWPPASEIRVWRLLRFPHEVCFVCAAKILSYETVLPQRQRHLQQFSGLSQIVGFLFRDNRSLWNDRQKDEKTSNASWREFIVLIHPLRKLQARIQWTDITGHVMTNSYCFNSQHLPQYWKSIRYFVDASCYSLSLWQTNAAKSCVLQTWKVLVRARKTHVLLSHLPKLPKKPLCFRVGRTKILLEESRR